MNFLFAPEEIPIFTVNITKISNGLALKIRGKVHFLCILPGTDCQYQGLPPEIIVVWTTYNMRDSAGQSYAQRLTCGVLIPCVSLHANALSV